MYTGQSTINADRRSYNLPADVFVAGETRPVRPKKAKRTAEKAGLDVSIDRTNVHSRTHLSFSYVPMCASLIDNT